MIRVDREVYVGIAARLRLIVQPDHHVRSSISSHRTDTHDVVTKPGDRSLRVRSSIPTSAIFRSLHASIRTRCYFVETSPLDKVIRPYRFWGWCWWRCRCLLRRAVRMCDEVLGNIEFTYAIQPTEGFALTATPRFAVSNSARVFLRTTIYAWLVEDTMPISSWNSGLAISAVQASPSSVQ